MLCELLFFGQSGKKWGRNDSHVSRAPEKLDAAFLINGQIFFFDAIVFGSNNAVVFCFLQILLPHSFDLHLIGPHFMGPINVNELFIVILWTKQFLMWSFHVSNIRIRSNHSLSSSIFDWTVLQSSIKPYCLHKAKTRSFFSLMA